jgi:hypothetical protein
MFPAAIKLKSRTGKVMGVPSEKFEYNMVESLGNKVLQILGHDNLG